MLKKWCRRTVLILFLLSNAVAYICLSLGFAGKWVSKYEEQINLATLISIPSGLLLGMLTLYLYRDKLFKAGKTPNR